MEMEILRAVRSSGRERAGKIALLHYTNGSITKTSYGELAEAAYLFAGRKSE
jgi:hypothetical protein